MKQLKFLNLIKLILGNLVILVILLVLLEFLIRLCGVDPYREKSNGQSVIVSPENKYFELDSMLGYKHRPGVHHVTIDGAFHFKTTHNVEGYRCTSPSTSENNSRDQIWVMGCSFTHGWGLDDENTFPWHLQKKLPQYKIKNYGISGFGTLQILLQLRYLLGKNEIPKIVIVNHADFHLERNTNSFTRRKNLTEWNFLGDLDLIYGELKSDEFLIHRINPSYNIWYISKYIAIGYLFQNSYEKTMDRLQRKKARKLTERIILEIDKLCKDYDVEFLLTSIEKKSYFLPRFCEKHQINFTDISVDLRKKGFTNAPYDGHPSPISNLAYSSAILDFVEGTKKGLH